MKFFIRFNTSLPKPDDYFVILTSMLAVGSGTIGIDLQQVPNDPIRFIVRQMKLFDFKSI